MFKKGDKAIFSKGGNETVKRYGKAYMKMIGKKGGRPRKLSTGKDLQDKTE